MWMGLEGIFPSQGVFWTSPFFIFVFLRAFLGIPSFSDLEPASSKTRGISLCDGRLLLDRPLQEVLNSTPLNPTPATSHKRKRKLSCSFRNAALQKLHCNITLLQTASAEVVLIKSCAAASKKLQCNIEKAALQESGAFLPLSCDFQAPTFRHTRLGPADHFCETLTRRLCKTSLLITAIWHSNPLCKSSCS